MGIIFSVKWGLGLGCLMLTVLFFTLDTTGPCSGEVWSFPGKVAVADPLPLLVREVGMQRLDKAGMGTTG